MKTNIIYCLFLLAGWLGAHSSLAQPVFIDQPIQCGELLVFPHITDSTKYYYLPNKLRLGETLSGLPQFSFLRYVQNVKTKPGTDQVVEGDGGGIVHALVQLSVPESELSRAQSMLRSKTKNKEAVIVGPIVYKGGTFALISSFAEEGSDFTKKVVGVGRAPVFVGNKAACSIRLTKLGAKILWESCKTPTPDLSFSFVMDFAGYRSPMQARVEVDWDKVYKHEEFSAGVRIGTPYVSLGADIKAAFDELREDGTIKVINFGADDKMESMLDVAYKKILDMMFAPFSMPPGSEESTVEQIANGINTIAKGIQQSASAVSFNFAYEMKQQKKSGHYVIDLSKATMETINFRFDENLGSDVAQCKDCFRSVNLDDPFYKQRELLVSVDGLNSDQFSKYINFVTVSMKKTHANGAVTYDELRIAEKEFKDAQGNPFRLLYGWKDQGDNDRDKWLTYEYQTKWSFFGDHTVQQDWTKSDQLGLNVAPPFHPVAVSVEADPKLLQEAQIRLATVKFYYDYGAGLKEEQVTIKGTQQVPAALAEFMLKRGNYDYEYEIVWRLMGSKTLSSGRKKSSDALIYVDEIPADAKVL
ncbi:hypothetical protein [Parachryseolinea silvisoli]|uniref:hypothetical protein n=1 Tax=Parachryseolinea silvisoli TaxID=2873601 RepID=UPI002265A805|nr:hypothetical protein [Parachryseolinea silvisoli]MCD9018169.1 hypothetical protein [Parachryseolinea silvisoli]